MDEEEIIIIMDDGVASFFTRFGGKTLLVHFREAQPCFGDPE